MQNYILQNNQSVGPFSDEEIRRKIQHGEVTPQTLAWRPGMPNWVPLHTLFPSPGNRSTSPAAERNVVGIIAVVVGIISLIMLVSLFVLIVTMKHLARNPAFLMLVGFLALSVMAVSLGGIVAGILGMAKKNSRRRSAAIGLSLGIVSLLVMSGALLKGVTMFGSRASAVSDVTKASTRPITIAPETGSNTEDQALRRTWHQRNFIEAYQTIGVKNEQWDEAAIAFLSLAARSAVDDVDAPTDEERFTAAQKALDLGCKDPLVVYLAGKNQLELRRGTELIENGLEGLHDSQYAMLIKFMAASDLTRQYRSLKKSAEIINKTEKASLEILLEGLAKTKISVEDIVILQNQMFESKSRFFDKYSDRICRSLETNSNAPKWLVHRFRGQHHVAEAWKARGSGYASSVTEEGWKGFRDNLAKAEKELTSAWELEPKDPGAPTEMIKVKMGQSSVEEMRLWFDRAVKARFDHGNAYHQMLWGLRPRWFGNHEQMLAFGRQCLNTKRFDTIVPYYFFRAVKDISSEMEDEPDAIFEDAAVFADLSDMFEGYLNEPKQVARKAYYHSLYAIVAYKANDLDTSREQLKAVDFKLSENAKAIWNDDFTDFAEKVCAFGGPAATQVSAGETSRANFRLDKAIVHFTKAEALSATDECALRFIRGRLSSLKLEESLQKGDWIDFLPPTDFQGWKVENGEWTRNEDGTLEVAAGEKGMMLRSLARIGENFEIKGTIEFVSSSTGDFQAGILFGYPHPKSDAWQSIRIKRTKRDGEVIRISQHFYVEDIGKKIPIPDTNTFQIQCWQNQWNVYLNGNQVFQGYTPQKKILRLADDSMLGFGGYADQNKSIVRYRNVQIRRLKASPSAP